jgi:hypothetical protein
MFVFLMFVFIPGLLGYGRWFLQHHWEGPKVIINPWLWQHVYIYIYPENWHKTHTYTNKLALNNTEHFKSLQQYETQIKDRTAKYSNN